MRPPLNTAGRRTAADRIAAVAAATAATVVVNTVVRRLQLVRRRRRRRRLFAAVPSVGHFHDDHTAAGTAATNTATVGLAPDARTVGFREHYHLVVQIGFITVHVDVAAAVTAVTVRGHRPGRRERVT